MLEVFVFLVVTHAAMKSSFKMRPLKHAWIPLLVAMPIFYIKGMYYPFFDMRSVFNLVMSLSLSIVICVVVLYLFHREKQREAGLREDVVLDDKQNTHKKWNISYKVIGLLFSALVISGAAVFIFLPSKNVDVKPYDENKVNDAVSSYLGITVKGNRDKSAESTLKFLNSNSYVSQQLSTPFIDLINKSKQEDRPIRVEMIKPEMVVELNESVACKSREELSAISKHVLKGEMTKAGSVADCIGIANGTKVKVLSVDVDSVYEIGFMEIVDAGSKNATGMWSYTAAAKLSDIK